MSSSLTDVFTLDEVARAVGVPAAAVTALASSGGLRAVGNGRFFAQADVIRLAPVLRSLAAGASTPPPDALFSRRGGQPQRRQGPLVASVCVHGLLIGAILWLSSGSSTRTPQAAPPEAPRLVFLSIPGVGGGGGGSGARQKESAPKLERLAGRRASVSVPQTALAKTSPSPRETPAPQPQPVAPSPPAVQPPPEPLPSRNVVAPVVMTASAARDREGVVERPAPGDTVSRGVGTGGREGAGQGEGNGDGLGSGLGNGRGGGAGGGPYRPGTGIEPPRLLHEVKADFTESARRRQLAGDVVLEIVVNRDGSVGQITVTKGLGEGLDQRAIAAVRQWRFAPARRFGEPVDVVVEVSVEFKLR